MQSNKNKFYVTTPIYYVNAAPHLGSLYSTVLADVAARWNQLYGKNTFMLTGTDEHGQKIAETALKAGKEPKEFVDSFIDAFKDMWHAYNIEYNYFIRTTDSHHVKAVQDWLQQLINSGDIYKSFYTGWYCIHDEAYLTEKEVELRENETPLCPQCHRPTKMVSEESYFFRLSAYQDRILALLEENPDFITPTERRNEVINFVKGGLKDLSVSRSTMSWGIPFPNDKHHVTYVWADALNNYITAVGYGDSKRKEDFDYWWPADLQVMGKDIVRFHAVYWPAFLMASKLPLPKKLLVHGWLKMGEHKMSKSRGNVVDPKALLATFGADPIRYYLTRYMAINQDSPFSVEDMTERMNADLANDLGNLLNRLTMLAHKYDLVTVNAPHTWGAAEIHLRDELWTMINDVELEMKDYFFHRAYARVWKYIQQINSYLHAQEPWRIVKQDPKRFAEVISASLHALYGVGILVYPLMPMSMGKLLDSLGKIYAHKHDYMSELKNNPWNMTFTIKVEQPLFVKIEPVKEVMPETEVVQEQLINIEDFAKVELIVGTIEQVDEVPKSDKLYVLRVNFGDKGIRQVCSGVRKYFKPQELLNKQGVFVFNLHPRKMMGLESQGMMLFAQDATGALKMTTIEFPVPNGTRLQ
jgi:methionyl-tRNA synthetase